MKTAMIVALIFCCLSSILHVVVSLPYFIKAQCKDSVGLAWKFSWYNIYGRESSAKCWNRWPMIAEIAAQVTCCVGLVACVLALASKDKSGR